MPNTRLLRSENRNIFSFFSADDGELLGMHADMLGYKSFIIGYYHYLGNGKLQNDFSYFFTYERQRFDFCIKEE